MSSINPSKVFALDLSHALFASRRHFTESVGIHFYKSNLNPQRPDIFVQNLKSIGMSCQAVLSKNKISRISAVLLHDNRLSRVWERSYTSNKWLVLGSGRSSKYVFILVAAILPNLRICCLCPFLKTNCAFLKLHATQKMCWPTGSVASVVWEPHPTALEQQQHQWPLHTAMPQI